MRRVVVTGLGIASCLGNNAAEVTQSLREGRSGLKFNPSYAEKGMRCQVSGRPELVLDEVVDRRTLRFMGDAAAYAYLSMQQAIEHAGLTPEQVSNPRTGLVVGSGGASSFNQVWAADTLRAKGINRVGPFMVTRTMGSTVSACLATPFGIKGVNYSITSACATSAHCIGHAAQLIAWGKQDVVFAGGGEEEQLDAVAAVRRHGRDVQRLQRPAAAGLARLTTPHRDGFVIAGGGGMLVLEELRACPGARRQHHWPRSSAYGATSDGDDMVAPSGEGAVRCMQQALATVERAGRLHQRPRHLDAGRRSGRTAAPCATVFGERMPHDQLDQVTLGPLARRGRRARGDLLPADDAGRLRRGLGEHRDARSGRRRPADPAPAPGRAAAHGDVQQLRLRRHQRHVGVLALRRLRRCSVSVLR